MTCDVCGYDGEAALAGVPYCPECGANVPDEAETLRRLEAEEDAEDLRDLADAAIDAGVRLDEARTKGDRYAAREAQREIAFLALLADDVGASR